MKVYLDHHSTTPADPSVVEAMIPYFTEVFGNPASRNHEFGWKAEAAVEHARDLIARLIGASHSSEIIFTSGTTESIDLGIRGAVAAHSSRRGRHLITTQSEHSAVLGAMDLLEAEGFEVTRLPVDAKGRVDLGMLARAIRPETVLISIMFANNEIGTIHPIAQIGALCKAHDILFHVDGAQAVGKIDIDVQALKIDLLSFGAHKMYGPKGVGALYVRRKNPRVTLLPRMKGGRHERGLRPGTLNVPAIVGFGRAAELAGLRMQEDNRQITILRDRLQNAILAGLPDVTINGDPESRLPGNLSVTFGYIEGEPLMLQLREVAFSSGSACQTAGSIEPGEATLSHVLRAIGLSDDQILGTVRFGIGRSNTPEQIDYVASRICEVVTMLRRLSPLSPSGAAIHSNHWKEEITS